jgi:hypothetical protein
MSTLFFFLIIPALSISVVVYYGHNVLYIVFSFLFTILLLRNVKDKRIDVKIISFKSKEIKTLAALLLIPLLILLVSGIRSFNVLSLLSNVYDLRAQNSFSGIFAYTLFWIPSVIVFWILYSGFYTKEKINFYLIFFAITVSVLTFLYTGLKTQLYTPILVIFLFFIVKKTKHHFYNFSFLFPSILLFFGYVFPTIQILATVDRVIYLPALLQLRYIEFFSQNGLYLFKGSKISLLLPFTSNYTRAPGYIVDEAFGGGGMNGNTGSFGSIFGDMGIIGVLIILPVFITILSLLINSYSRNKTLNSLLGVYYGYTLINAPLIDIVLTHGIIIHIIILKYFNSKNNFYETQHKFL